jgi:hypothetical protein
VDTSVDMIDRHYAGILANWDGHAVPAERQIRDARALLARNGGRCRSDRGSSRIRNPCKSGEALCRTRTGDLFLTMEVEPADDG